MTKILIIVIVEELVIITMITVIKLTYRRNSMEKKKKKKKKKKANKETKLTWLRNCSSKRAQKYVLLLMSQTLNRNVKKCYRKKKVKNNGTYNTLHGPLSQEWIDGRCWSPALICHANQSSGYYITLIQGCTEIMSQHPIK